jgi:hypothetical protein
MASMSAADPSSGYRLMPAAASVITLTTEGSGP